MFHCKLQQSDKTIIKKKHFYNHMSNKRPKLLRINVLVKHCNVSTSDLPAGTNI